MVAPRPGGYGAALPRHCLAHSPKAGVDNVFRTAGRFRPGIILLACPQ